MDNELTSRTARSLIAACSAGLFTLGSTGDATAAFQYVYVYDNGAGTCVADYSEITPADGGTMTSKSSIWSNSCGTQSYAGANTLATNMMTLWYDFNTASWIKCGETGWFYNATARYEMRLYAVNVQATCVGINHWYANNTGAYGAINGAWQGGWYPSGNEWITSTALAPSKPPAEPKISAADAVRTGQVRIGSPQGPKATKAQLQPAPGRRDLPFRSASRHRYEASVSP
ncbi:hypothetical protein [Streptomyces tendae]|uniref:hypothetical protein n=1 Tax=Streptomyces tendae TaxID=1932 RepID=UPI0037117E57